MSIPDPPAAPIQDVARDTFGADLDRSFVRGIAWTGGVKWGSQIAAWISTIIVARILTPDDYGLVSMATVYLGFISLFSEFGLGTAVVTLRDMTDDHIAQLNTLSVVFGVVIFGLSCAAAAPLGRFFASPQLPAVVVVMSVTFIISSFQSIPSSLLRKDLQFKTLSVIAGIQAVVLAVATVIFAVLGLRYWTLVLGALLSSLMATVLTLAVRRHGFSWPRMHSLEEAVRFSWQVLVSRVAWYAYSNSDFVVAGRFLGQTALGVYTVAWNFANAPLEKITSMVSGVTPSYYAAVQKDPAALRRYLLKPTEALALVVFPIMVGLALVSHDAVRLVLGQKWIGCVPALQLLALYACIRSIMPLLPQVLTVTGDTGFAMWNGVISAILLPVAFLFGSHWGITGIAAAWVLAYPINFVPLYWRVTRRIQLETREYLHAISPALYGIAAITVAVLALRAFVSWRLTLPGRLGLEVTGGALAYILTVGVFHRQRVLGLLRAFSMLR